MKPKEFDLVKAGIEQDVVKKIKEERGEVLTPLLERFLHLWDAGLVFPTPLPEKCSCGWNLEAFRLEELVRDLAVEVVKIKQELKRR